MNPSNRQTRLCASPRDWGIKEMSLVLDTSFVIRVSYLVSTGYIAKSQCKVTSLAQFVMDFLAEHSSDIRINHTWMEIWEQCVVSQRHDNQILHVGFHWSRGCGQRPGFSSDTPLTYRLMYANASLTLLVPQRYLPSSTRSPPVASPKSYHSFSRSLTLNDGVTSFLRGERYQYCSDFIYCARWPSWAKVHDTHSFCFVYGHKNFFHLFCAKRFSLVCALYINTKLNWII